MSKLNMANNAIEALNATNLLPPDAINLIGNANSALTLFKASFMLKYVLPLLVLYIVVMYV